MTEQGFQFSMPILRKKSRCKSGNTYCPRVFNNERKSAQSEKRLRIIFSFSLVVTKTDFAFLWHTGKMNTGKKHFDPARRNGAAGTREVSKGGPGGLPLAHDLARKV